MGTPTHHKSAVALSQCFGTLQFMSKEDHERERSRWQQRLDETEEKLLEISNTNSHMIQIKAQLNKKIIEFEKNQKPLIDQNKRLNERNRNLQQEIRKVNDKLSHAQTDLIGLKDSYDKVVKDNLVLREQRTFPEKLKELDRYRNQALEYSKCITALRHAGMEKDRRIDLLFQKYKRLRRVLMTKSGGDCEDDKLSQFGSDCSVESFSCLDTINEDLVEFEQIEKNIKNESYNQMNESTDSGVQSDYCKQLLEIIKQQKDDLSDCKGKCEALENELSTSKESNDLLEFQILELTENLKDMVPTENLERERTNFTELMNQNNALLKTAKDGIDQFKKNLPKMYTSFLSNNDLANYILDDDMSYTEKLKLISLQVGKVNKQWKQIIKERIECEKIHDAERDGWKNELEKMYDQLQEALQNYKVLEDKQNPIRSLLERRLEEGRHRLKEALETIENYEALMTEANQRIVALEGNESMNKDLRKKVTYLQTYVSEFESQFASQVDVINLLKKQLELVR
uniref:JAKMIP_CC3 domain-containing protein n=1 Tax=Rhabditophanes sp. KR3021 TaxID=114890 RepID=A0AC35U5G3_9BILA